MEAVPTSVAGYQESLALAKSRGQVAARIQIEKVIEQARTLAEPGSNFDQLIAGATDVPSSLREQLSTHAEAGRESFSHLADFLAAELLPAAPENEACGREAYALYSRDFLGAEVDFDETYAWGLEELARIDAEQREVAEKIQPGADLFEVMETLNKDPKRTLHGAEGLREWMQKVADEAITELGKSHFDIPEPVRTIECMIAPSATGGIYYTGPTDDFSRPGRMWWSVPEGVTEFATWQEKTTVYHEGVPGHHLQVGQATYVSDTLNRWRRLMCWVSGHGEGWALYAEKLMADLGFIERSRRLPGYARFPTPARRTRGSRHRIPPGTRGARQPRRRDLESGEGLAVPHRQCRHGSLLPRLRTRPLPRLARAGPELQDRTTAVGAVPR